MSSLVNSESLALGMAEVRIAEYSLNIADSGVALTSANSVGYIGSASIIRNTEKVTVRESEQGQVFDGETFVTSQTMVVDCSFSEQTIGNVDAALGGAAVLSQTSEVRGELSLSLPNVINTFYRLEVRIKLKDSANIATFVLPKCIVTSEYTITPAIGDMAISPLQFSTVPAYEGVWYDNPIGKIVYHAP